MMPVELGTPAFLLLLSWGAIFGLTSVWIFRRWSNTLLLRSSINRVLAHLLEFHLFSAEPSLIFKAQRDLVLSNLRVLRLAAIPSLILLIPFLLFFTVADRLFAHAPLQPGQAAVVTAQFNDREQGWSTARLAASPGLAVDAGPVRVPSEWQISWRIQALRPANGSLELSTAGHVISKTVTVQRAWHGIPLEWPLTGFSSQSVTISYPPAVVFRAWPLLWFFIGSFVGALFYVPLKRLSTRHYSSVLPAVFLAATLHADTVSPLFARGYSVLPQPQKVALKESDLVFDGAPWLLQRGSNVPADSAAVESLIDGLRERYGIALGKAPEGAVAVRLDITPGSIEPGASQDRDRESIRSQAYRLTANPSGVQITANAPAGLFYGVQTLLQLVKPDGSKFRLPQGEITDWPDLGRRQIYWDDAHHLDRMPEFEAAIRHAAFFKINGLVIKLEGHFQYSSAPALVEPQALSPGQLQHLTDYGLRRHVQVIPYLDSPAHIAFILKHPEYQKLRAFPESNYELCTTNPDSLNLLHGMFDDLLAANRGVKYFYLSTDESYYVGMAANSQCDEAARAKELGSRGKLLAEFVGKAAGYLHDRGREVIFWGEYPLKPDDIPSLPKFIINGETYGPDADPVYRSHGIRQMIYASVQGEERLFPHYFMLPGGRRIHKTYEDYPRVSTALEGIATNSGRRNSDLIGLIVAAWGDMGLHNETFWMGYATAASSGWRSFSGGANEAMSAFYPLWYGPRADNMNRLYQLMSFQAQIWTDTWDQTASKDRTGIWGNSKEIYAESKPAHDPVISLPPVPSDDLQYRSKWQQENAARLMLANDALPGNDELLGLLNDNMLKAKWHRYGLEVFHSVAQLCRQNLEFLGGWKHVDDLLIRSADYADKSKPELALQSLDEALEDVRQMKDARNEVLKDATATWCRTWLPRVAKANGRRFLHQVDDVKDHLPDRTVDMSYLVHREMLLPVDDWFARAQRARNAYAQAHRLPVKQSALAWESKD